MSCEGIDIFWMNGEKIFRREYNYRGPDDTYRIIDLDCDEEFQDNNGRLKLESEKKYILGLDMSTTQSGIAILDSDWNVVTMIDLINNGEKKDNYLNHLRAVFNSNFKRLKFELVVLEEQIATENGRMIYGKLSELQGSILSMSGIFGINIQRIKPQVWKSAFLKSDKYKGRRQKTIDSKISAGEEVETRFPYCKLYIDTMTNYSKADQGYICDSCDAVGLVLGYLELNYGEDRSLSSRVVNKTMNYENKHDITRKFFALDIQTGELRTKKQFSSEEYITYLDKIFVNEVRDFGKITLLYNPALDLNENIRRCTSTFSEICFILVRDKKSCVKIQWESGLDMKDNEMMLIVCHSTNHIVRKQTISRF